MPPITTVSQLLHRGFLTTTNQASTEGQLVHARAQGAPLAHPGYRAVLIFGPGQQVNGTVDCRSHDHVTCIALVVRKLPRTADERTSAD